MNKRYLTVGPDGTIVACSAARPYPVKPLPADARALVVRMRRAILDRATGPAGPRKPAPCDSRTRTC